MIYRSGATLSGRTHSLPSGPGRAASPISSDLICDRHTYGEVFIRRVRSVGIRYRPTSPRSPWQNAYAERLIGSIRRECLDHVVVFGERHLRHVLSSYMKTIMRRARTYRWKRMRPYRVRFREQGVFFALQSWASCIINIFGFDLRQAQAPLAVADHLAKINYQVHLAGKQVGPRCVVAWRHRRAGVYGGGGGIILHWLGLRP